MLHLNLSNFRQDKNQFVPSVGYAFCGSVVHLEPVPSSVPRESSQPLSSGQARVACKIASSESTVPQLLTFLIGLSLTQGPKTVIAQSVIRNGT